MKLGIAISRWGMVRRLIYIAVAIFLDWRIIHNFMNRQLAQPLGPYAMIVAYLLAIFVLQLGVIQVILWREAWALRAALRGNMALAPLMERQPNPTEALQPGESLTLTRSSWPSLGAVLVQMPFALIAIAFLLAICETIAYGAYPSQLAWMNHYFSGSSNMRYPIPPAGASLADRLIYLAPFVVSALVVGLMGWSSLENCLQQITANDQGITLRRAWGPRHFISWNEIQLILASVNTDGSIAEYSLLGRRAHAILDLSTSREIPNGKTYPLPYTFSGGRDGYHADAARLAATLTARAHVSLRYWISPLWRAKPEVPNYRKVPELEYIEFQPLAPVSLQPTSEEIERANSFSDVGSIKLANRFPFRSLALQMARDAAIGAVGLVAVMFVTFAAVWLTTPGSSQPLQNIFLFIFQTSPGVFFVVYILAFGAAMGAMVTWGFYRNAYPIVVATDEGIAVRKGTYRQQQPIPWESLRAWAIRKAPDTTAAAATHYVIFTNTRKVEWREPFDAELAGRGVQGDRREAYREAARHLHALIAARTGLPLREIGDQRA